MTSASEEHPWKRRGKEGFPSGANKDTLSPSDEEAHDVAEAGPKVGI